MAAPPAAARPAPAAEQAPTVPPPPLPAALGVSYRRKGDPEQRVSFANQLYVTIGRGQQNDVCLGEGNVSKQHARVELRDGELLLTDLGSTNGTYLNGRKVEQEAAVTPGDRVYIGDYILRFELDPQPAEPAPPSREPQPEQRLARYEQFAHALLQRALDLEGGSLAERFEALCQQAEQHYDPQALGPLLAQGEAALGERGAAAQGLIVRAIERVVALARDAPPADHQPPVVRLGAVALRRLLLQRSA